MTASRADPGGARPLRVAVLAGGISAEHEISVASARSISEGLEAAGHEVLAILIQRDGCWLHEGRPLSLSPGAGLLDADVAFPALHGRFGEDGAVQGLLEALDVAYVGAGVAASALCMDKVLFKDLMSVHGLPQVRYRAVREPDWRRDPAGTLAALDELGLPVFVKPVHLGSSVGIVKVGEADLLAEVIEGAFARDSLVIVEAMADGIEVECAVIGTLAAGAGQGSGAGAYASVPGEITYAGEWYDYEAKYSPGGMELVVPARISPASEARVRELATEAFRRTGCEGLARVDFFVEGDRVLLNELNTMPGFTPTSVYAKLLEADGVPYAEIVDRLCRLALLRHGATRRHGR